MSWKIQHVSPMKLTMVLRHLWITISSILFSWKVSKFLICKWWYFGSGTRRRCSYCITLMLPVDWCQYISESSSKLFHLFHTFINSILLDNTAYICEEIIHGYNLSEPYWKLFKVTCCLCVLSQIVDNTECLTLFAGSWDILATCSVIAIGSLRKSVCIVGLCTVRCTHIWTD